ncbi:hypothetical protein [Planobispora longispora]|uniref:Uncharacterized protein n=1 Tax=Planobispora longispora TaxID=28887 RepID=A0A8J3RLS0_9ACTN|nr:hypothetical protein [Planobispora longispora]BFE82793.1 hypothetical protein GCM10020093_053940 [Planobispora longispora]GIH78022.1 hypothetical protein Plo01_44510 [Planobispora longispora]
MLLSLQDAGWERVRRRYAGVWSIWRSDAGRWYATRTTGPLSQAELDAGLVMTAHGDDAEVLEAILAEQERVGGSAAAL